MNKPYDLAAGYKGNGLTIWDRNELKDGDYKALAFISETGEISYTEHLPDQVRAQIEQLRDGR
jgi:hypothetical protein